MNQAREVTVYYKPSCPYSQRALRILSSKSGVNLNKIDITDNNELREQMIRESSRTTVPQIFIGDHHVGGCDDLIALEQNQELDRLLYE